MGYPVKGCGLPGVGRTLYSDRQRLLVALLRELREEAGLRQVDVAEALDVHQSYVSKYESGDRRLDLVELHDIVQVLGTSLVDLVNRFEKGLKRKTRRR